MIKKEGGDTMAKKKFVQNDNNLAIAYYRFSSNAQNEQSIDQQRQAAERYAEAKGFRIIKEYEDRAISGTTDKRPGFRQMLYEIKDIKPAVLILWKIDRLGRDRELLVIARADIRDAGCKIESITEPTPDEAMGGVIMEGVLDALAEHYSLQLGSNVSRALRYKAERGLCTGQKPLGYERGEDDKYAINQNEAPIVKRIFDDYVSGKPLAEISKELHEQGVAATLERKFTIESLRAILHNEAYIGIYKRCGFVIEGGMPTIVTQEIFDKVQKRFDENKRKGTQRAKELGGDEAPRYWLTGKLFCGECGSGMQGISGTSHTGKIHYYYSCAEYRRKKCKKRNIRKDIIEKTVADFLVDILGDTANRAGLAVDAADYYKERYTNTGYIDSLKAEKKETEKKLSNIVKAIERGTISDIILKRLAELEVQDKALAETIATEQIKKDLTEDEHSIQAYFEKYSDVDIDKREMREELLDYFIDKIYVYEDHLDITGWFTGDKQTIAWGELANVDFESSSNASCLSQLVLVLGVSLGPF